MKDESQWIAARTIDLGYEQLLLVEDERGSPVGALYRGVWLTPQAAGGDERAAADAARAAGAQRLPLVTRLLDQARRC